jgi:DNA-binding MarR family transcriptional regulator
MEAIPVGRVIDRLEKTGFVERRADPADRRRWRLYLTPKAHAVVGEMEVIAGELRDDALRGIARNDLDTLMSVLNSIKENLATLDASPEEERKVS